MNEKKDFFTDDSTLQIKPFAVIKNEQFIKDNASTILKSMLDETGIYQVVARLSFALLFGWYKDGRLVFSKTIEIDDSDVEEIRAFNTNKEVLLQRRGDLYWVRAIEDQAGDEVKAVDSTSRLFGKVTGDQEVPEGFAKLYEGGRKIQMVIPADDGQKDDIYAITTRSYIKYDEITGQAGFGYSRYVAIRKERGNE